MTKTEVMENQSPSFGTLFEHAGEYLETRLDLLKLQAIDKASDAASSAVSRLAIVLIGVFALLLLNVGLSLWVGDLVGKDYLGFFIVAGFYILLAVIIHFAKDTWIKGPISTMIIKKMLK
jgi:hypothetical protein